MKDQQLRNLRVLTVDSQKWEALVEFLGTDRTSLITQLLKCNDIESTKFLQGKIFMIDRILSIPEEQRKLK